MYEDEDSLYDTDGETETEKHPIKNEPKDPLTFLFRDMAKTRGPWYQPMEWEKRMQIYLSDRTNMIPPNGRDRSSARGNLNKALYATRMTFKTFYKGLKFLGAISVTFHAEVRWGKFKYSTHSTTVHIHGAVIPEDGDEDIIEEKNNDSGSVR